MKEFKFDFFFLIIFGVNIKDFFVYNLLKLLINQILYKS